MPNQARQPNILLVLTDQHSPRVSGFAGDAVVRTQHLDALSSEAIQFDTAVCASPVCTPSRMCMLTGMEAHRCAAWNNHWVIFPEHLTWPAHFAAQPEHASRCQIMREALFRGFGWEQVHEQLAKDRERLPEFFSGQKPSTPNQYMLPDGRVFDAESDLYGARWLDMPEHDGGGSIPQQFG